MRDPCDSHRSDLDQKRRQNVLRTLMTEIRDPRSVRQSQIRFRPEKCAKNTNEPFIYGFLFLFDVCDPQMNSHMEK